MKPALLPAAAGLLLAAACGGTDTPPRTSSAAEAPAAAATEAPVARVASAGEELPTILVYKSPSCGCCNGWVEHLEAAGFKVDARNVQDLMSVKLDAGVPAEGSSCHTALVDGYVVEGHVPADVVRKLLAERPPVTGITVPGMPVGSPGMEGPNPEPYQVLTFDRQGTTGVFADVDPR